VQTTVSFIEQIASNLNGWSSFRRGGMYVYAGTPDAVQQMQDEWLAVKQTGYEPISSRPAARATGGTWEGPTH
jgi:hypothetical protein